MFELLKQKGVDFVYPPYCYHCREALGDGSHYLCKGCSDLLELLSPHSRCFTCFCELSQPGKCLRCRKETLTLTRVAAALAYEGPGGSFVRRLKYYNQSYLSKGLAGYLVAQWERLNWPLPDAIIPVPISMTHWFQRGYNHSQLLAEEMGQILNRPVHTSLQRRSGGFSQAALNRTQRRELSKEAFYLKENTSNYADQILLLIDDVMTTGSTLKRCADVLSTTYPAAIYALTATLTSE